MLDITVIILTYNENIHIKRCIENALLFAKDVFIVDSYSTDDTVEIARQSGAGVYQNKWENNHAKQFNWALNHLPIKTEWVFRLDADEYVTEELLHEMHVRLPQLEENITAVILPLKRVFLGRWIERGTGRITQMRLFRYGKAQCEVRWMDEHIELLEGVPVTFQGAWVDHNLNNISWWTTKHIGYAIREAITLLDIELDLTGNARQDASKQFTKETSSKRNQKHTYAKQPLFFRAFGYFIYRYIFKLGFTEGREGFLFHFLQGWWYRTLVDVKVFEIKRACGRDKEKIKQYIKEQYHIEI